MDVKDIILEGLTYTVMGISVVFLVLIIIMLVIKAMALFSKVDAPEKKEEPVAVPAAVQAPAANDDTELVAVITAAIACAMGTSANNLVIRSYKKVSGGAWNKAGRREVLDNRL